MWPTILNTRFALSANKHRDLLLLPLLFLLSIGAVFAQGTAFTFQGKLGDNGSPVNGSFDMQFKLFDSADPNSSNQVGTTITLSNPLVQVTNGVFTVQLDFGAGALPGADRFLEIGIRRNNAEPYNLLSPRSKVTSSPYAIRSLNATDADGMSTNCVGCILSSHISSVDASKLTGTLPASAISANSLPAGSTNYIQNTTSQQTGNFNLLGSGVISGEVGIGAMAPGNKLNVTGNGIVRARINSDSNGGFSLALNDQPRWSIATVTGGDLQIFNDAMHQLAMSVSGSTNVIAGNGAGLTNLDAGNIKSGTLSANRGGTGLSSAGTSGNFLRSNGATWVSSTLQSLDIPSGSGNYIQNGTSQQGTSNFNISGNGTVAGHLSGGDINTQDSYKLAGISVMSPSFGVGGTVIINLGNASGSTPVNVRGDLTVRGATTINTGLALTLNNQPKWSVATLNSGYFQIFNHATGQYAVQIDPANGNFFTNGRMQLGGFYNGGLEPICRGVAGTIATCSSSIRYKNNVNRFTSGFSLIDRLRPVTFNWKANNASDLGLIAEEVAKVEPLLVTHNDKGEVEGVKYDRVAVVLINAVKEQQAQIEQQQSQIASLRTANATLNSQLRAIERRLRKKR